MYSPAGSGYGYSPAPRAPVVAMDRLNISPTDPHSRSPGLTADYGRTDNGYVPGSHGRGLNYPDANGGLSSPYGSDVNPFDHSFAGRPAMTSSQQDVRPAPPHSGPVSYVPSGGPTGGGVRMPYPDERLSERGSSVANPLDERFSEAESSVVGFGEPGADPRYSGSPWRPTDNVGPRYEHDVPSSAADPAYRLPPSDPRLDLSTNTASHGFDTKWRNPDLCEVIAYLSHEDDLVKANAAAYLQHLTYMDDNIKAETRVLRGIPALVDLVSHPEVGVHRSACGALRNLTYGKANYKNKRDVKNAGGITNLERLLRTTNDIDTCDLVTGVLWNLSSAQDLKKSIIDDSLQTLVDYIIKPAASSASSAPPVWTTTIFRNASSILRNVSSDGEYARNKLRECNGLVDSVIAVVRASLSGVEMDSKAVENCVCVMRNLSYACQEVADPDYLRRRETKSATNDNGGTGCFGGKKKSPGKESSKSKSRSSLSTRLPGRAMSSLWHVDTVRVYLPLLKDCTNPDTLEAAAGAIQNLTAGDWQPAVDIRTAVRQEKGLPIINELLSLNSDRVVCAAATALRNLALDPRNKELIGKYALPLLVRKLPSPVRQSELMLSDETIAAVESALYEIIKTNSTHARSLLSEGGIERLLFITRSPVGNYSDKVVKFATQLLQKMWRFTEFRDEYQRKGWRQSDFASGVGKSLPPSAENTINRPRETESGPGHPNTLHIDRGLHHPPPYTPATLTTPYHASDVRDSYHQQPPQPSPHETPSRYVEMSYVSRPPVYDSRHQLDGEPPGYLDTSQREFPHDRDRGYILDDRGYPADDRSGGYTGDRDFRPINQQGFPGEFSEHDRGYGGRDERYPGGDVSYDSQAMMMPGISSEDFTHRDDGYNRPLNDPMSVHLRDPADRPYGADHPYNADPMSVHIRDPNDHMYSDRDFRDDTQRNYPADRGHEPVYARVQKPNQFGDVQLDTAGDYRSHDVDSWV